MNKRTHEFILFAGVATLLAVVLTWTGFEYRNYLSLLSQEGQQLQDTPKLQARNPRVMPEPCVGGSFTDLDKALETPEKVCMLDLSNQGLTELPPEIFQFINLKRLNLDNNNLTALPAEIGSLSSLKRLDVVNNQIEKLPHTFIHSSCIIHRELEEGFSAFSSDNEYKDISPPLVDRFDTVVDLAGIPATKTYLNYPLAESVWDLYNVGALGGFDKFAAKLKKSFEADRAIKPRPNLKENFTKTIGLNIKQNHVKIPPEEIKSFANWVYSNPTRCPSNRFGYELWHKMVRNITDIPEDSDLEDFHNIGCLPYVDIMTVDRRMYGYARQVSSSITVEYDKKLFKKVKDFMNLI